MKDTLAFVVGRMRPPHNGHLHLINEAFKLADTVLVLVGSSNACVSPKNPFTFEQVKDVLLSHYADRTLFVLPLNDHPGEDLDWMREVISQVSRISGAACARDVILVGHKKDHSCKYLDWFPQYEYYEAECQYDIHATDLRHAWFMGNLEQVKDQMPVESYSMLDKLQRTTSFPNLREWFLRNREEALDWQDSPYKPVFLCADMVLIRLETQEVLMVKRADAVGHGLWALPGGHHESGEFLLETAIRECIEETGVAVTRESAIQAPIFVDTPGRSTRPFPVMSQVYVHGHSTISSGEPTLIPQEGEVLEVAWKNFFSLDPRQCFDDHWHILNRIHKSKGYVS